MAKGYRPVDRDQPFLLPPDMREWLPRSHAVWLVIDAVRLLDTSAFHARRRTGGAGRAGYDPDMLVTLLIWAYANGITSSRRIERLCGQDVAFRVICAGDAPDHVTVARFRQQFADTAAPLFAEVLALCARLGMGKVGTIALDGTKIGANASKDANRTEAGLRKLAEDLSAAHAAADAEDDARHGKGRRGDGDPGDPFTRRDRVAAALAGLEAEREAREAAERDAAAAHLQAARAGAAAPPGRPPAGAGAATARAALERETAACLARIDDWERRRAAGEAGRSRRPADPEQSSLVRRAAAKLDKAVAREAARAEKQRQKQQDAPPVRNVTDPDSRLMPVRGGGFIQGYNPQNVVSGDGLIIATRLTSDTTDTRWYQPMIRDALTAAAAMAAADAIALVLADAGYLSDANLTCPGPDRLIATGKRRDLEKAARAAEADGAGQVGGADPGEEEAPEEEAEGTATAAMAARLKTPDGIAAYRQRGRIAETPHARIKHNMGIRRLAMRGMPRASGEWQLICAAHNLMLAVTSGSLTPQTLANLAR
jgi:transposase